MKRVSILILAAIMMFIGWNPSVATAYSNPTVYLDGRQLYFEVPAQILSGRTMVPMRAIFEELGASIYWDQYSRTVSSSKGSSTFSMTIGSNNYTVNGESKYSDVAAQIINDRTLVPLRVVSESLGCAVNYDGPSNIITITSGSNPGKVDDTYGYSICSPMVKEYKSGTKHQSILPKSIEVYADLVDGRNITLTLSCGSWDISDQCQVSMVNGQVNYTIDFPDKSTNDPTDGGDILRITFHGGDLPDDPNYIYKFTIDGLKINLPGDTSMGDVYLRYGGSIGISGDVQIGSIIPNN